MLKLYLRIDIDESGTVAHEEIKEGLKKIDKSLHINKEECAYLIQQAKLQSTQNQFTYSDFAQMISAEMRITQTERSYMLSTILKGPHVMNSYSLFECELQIWST